MNSTDVELDPGYEALRIINIQNGEAVRANNRNVRNVIVKLAVSPGPWAVADHRVVVLLDGERYNEAKHQRFELINLDRGQHTLQGMVIDPDGRELIRSEPVTFYVKRVSARLPQR